MSFSNFGQFASIVDGARVVQSEIRNYEYKTEQSDHAIVSVGEFSVRNLSHWFRLCVMCDDCCVKDAYSHDDYVEAVNRAINDVATNNAKRSPHPVETIILDQKRAIAEHLYTLTMAHNELQLREVYDKWLIANPNRTITLFGSSGMPFTTISDNERRVCGMNVHVDEDGGTISITQKMNVSELECSICMESVFSSVSNNDSITICENGHRTCTKCIMCADKMQCPTCRSVILITDCVTGPILRTVTHECTYVGCNHSGFPVQMVKHRAECEHKPIECLWCKCDIDPMQYFNHVTTKCVNVSCITASFPLSNLNFMISAFSELLDGARTSRNAPCTSTHDQLDLKVYTGGGNELPQLERDVATYLNHNDDNSDDDGGGDMPPLIYAELPPPSEDASPPTITKNTSDTFAPVTVAYIISANRILTVTENMDDEKSVNFMIVDFSEDSHEFKHDQPVVFQFTPSSFANDSLSSTPTMRLTPRHISSTDSDSISVPLNMVRDSTFNDIEYKCAPLFIEDRWYVRSGVGNWHPANIIKIDDQSLCEPTVTVKYLELPLTANESIKLSMYNINRFRHVSDAPMCVELLNRRF